ncbi:hypothetical protein CBR_g38876 [Chara braunii]|uniref:Uncharacterized protein n=1 Tax=Chara braunii TaxID=69332 RepID=A0A388LQU5_CHABU|nr:hypothetical protein CBR_g38876 [Chara braunii]|eukprot:GBG84593.1 hypothetical protein CBR_g38876 [Chara braunii]
MIGFSDLAVLAGAWERNGNDFDDELGVLCEKLELRKQKYMKECRELGGRSAKVEQILLKIWGVDDSHLAGRVPVTRASNSPNSEGTPTTRCDDLAIEEEERVEMERAIAAITAIIQHSTLMTSRKGGDASERDQYTAFAPLAFACWIEHTSTRFRHAIWKMGTFNHLASISIRALQFLGNVTDEQVKQCKTQILKGKLKYCGRVNPLDPQDLKFPPMRELDPDKCGETNSGTWQKGIRQEGKADLRTLRKIWNVGRRYLKCKCKKIRSKDCGDTPLWFDHAIWYLMAHPDILFPTMSSIKAINELGNFLDKLFAQVMELRDLTDSTKAFLRKIILKKGRGRMEKYRTAHRHATAEPFEHPAVKRELQFLTGRFLICPTDKAPNTPAFICNNFIRKLAFQRLSGPEFASINAPPTSVISRIRGELFALPALPVPAVLPYLMTVPKGTFRWIMNIANTIISPAAEVKGIPVGLACSPIWCDIYFFKYEYHAMMRLVDTGNTHLFPCFGSTFRYIPDLGAINNAVVSSFLRKKGERQVDDPCWIYPEEFIKIKENTELNEEGLGRIANFLNMTMTVTSPITGSYSTTRHDKCTGLVFSPCRFMKFRSNRSVKQSLQIITAQVAQIFLLCSEPEDAANEIAKVVAAMRGNGFVVNACWKVVKKTLQNAYLYQPGRLFVHMIREAMTNLHGITG